MIWGCTWKPHAKNNITPKQKEKNNRNQGTWVSIMSPKKKMSKTLMNSISSAFKHSNPMIKRGQNPSTIK